MFNFGDDASIDFSYRYLKFTHGAPMRTLADRVTTLRAFAASEVGEDQADNLMEVWSALDDAQRNLEILDFGGMLRFGDVLNRWISRPMVPFPQELTAAEKKDYAQFLFQAKGEEQADDLVDIQAMREYEGWGAHLLFQRTIELTLPRMNRALNLVDGIAAAAKDDATRAQWELMGKRLQATIYLLESEKPGCEARSESGPGRAIQLGSHGPDGNGAQGNRHDGEPQPFARKHERSDSGSGTYAGRRDDHAPWPERDRANQGQDQHHGRALARL
jgi:hypothetical protein